jgi:hypothetical protein
VIPFLKVITVGCCGCMKGCCLKVAACFGCFFGCIAGIFKCCCKKSKVKDGDSNGRKSNSLNGTAMVMPSGSGNNNDDTHMTTDNLNVTEMSQRNLDTMNTQSKNTINKNGDLEIEDLENEPTNNPSKNKIDDEEMY